jgi:uncharacterized membrane protein
VTLLVTDSKIIAQQNNSLSTAATVKLVIALAAVSMSVGVGFALAGAWMVMPFAGLEILAIAYSFYYIQKHSVDYESITVTDDSVVIERFELNNDVAETVFQRYWAKVILREGENGRLGLFIGSHGKELEFGKKYLNNEQRAFLVRELRQKIKYNETFETWSD